MILAAGLGTRLRPLTDELPKPLVPVGDAPLVAQIARSLARQGFDRVVLNTHHRAESFDRLDASLAVELVHEREILGTAGGVANARGRFRGDGPVLVWNGDIFADVDVGALRAATTPEVAVTWLVAPRPTGQGTVGLDARGRVVRVREFRGGDEVKSGDFLGVSLLSRAVVDALPSRGCLVGDAIVPLLERGGVVAAVEHVGPWDDIGNAAAYLRANARWLAATGRGSWVASGAAIAEGVEIDGALVGEGARIDGSGRLRRCVVWPGAVARAPLENCIVTTSGRVVDASLSAA